MAAKREPNEYVQGGRYMIEHCPDDKEEPWHVWDLKLIFSNDHQSFDCTTKTEATRLCAILAEIEAP